MKFCKLLLAIAGAGLLMAGLTSISSARNVSTSHQTWRASFRSVTIFLPFGNTVCAISLSGSLHSRTMAKIAGSLVGYVNRAVLGACSSGAATILTETLPWHMAYRSFAGRLPSILWVEFGIINASLRVREPNGVVTCLLRSTAVLPMIGTFLIISRVAEEMVLTGEAPSGSECFGQNGAIFSEFASMTTASSSSTRITVTLI